MGFVIRLAIKLAIPLFQFIYTKRDLFTKYFKNI